MSEICAINGMIDTPTALHNMQPHPPCNFAKSSTSTRRHAKTTLPQLVHMMYISTSLVISEYNITQFRFSREAEGMCSDK